MNVTPELSKINIVHVKVLPSEKRFVFFRGKITFFHKYANVK